MSTLTIAGVVIDSQTKQPLPKVRIEAWDKDVKLSDVVGSYLTDEQGRFSISYDELRFRENPKDKWADIYFKVYNGNLLLADERNTQLFRNLSKNRLDITVAVNAQQYDSVNTFAVQGRIRTNRKIDFTKLIVNVFDRDLRNEQKLATTNPDASGNYLAEYTMANARRAEKGTADLLIRVTDETGKVVGESAILFNASYHEVIDVTVDHSSIRGLSTLETVTRLVTPLLDKLEPAELTENEKNKDISFLSAELDLGQELLENFAAAHQLHRLAPVDVSFYFALLNLNIPARAMLLTAIDFKQINAFSTYVYLQTEAVLNALQSVSLAEMETVINTAADKNIIDAVDSSLLKRWLSQWEAYKKKRGEDPVVKRTIVENILDIADLPKEQRKVFVDNYNAALSIGTEFWKGLGSGKKINVADTEKIKAIYNLADMVGHDMATTAHVVSKFKVNDHASLRKLSTLDQKEWEGVLKTTSAKKGKVSTEAKELTKRFEKEFPTASFIANAGRSKRNLEELPSLQKFHATFPDAELHKINVAQFLEENKNELKVAKKEKDTFVNDLMKVQRVFKIAPQYRTTEVLLDNNVHSSAAVYQMGEDNFAALLASEAGVERADAIQMYKRAEATHALSIAIAGDFHSMTTGGAVSALPSFKLLQAQTSLLKELPDLQTLFGSADMCDCQHCRSVYSSAAYMVDILEYLDKRRSTTPGQSVRSVLFKRRADIGEIELTCANTNTPMPFIDLVCEILENAVADQAWTLPTTIGAQLAISPISNTLRAAIVNHKLAIADTATVQPGKDSNEWIVRDNSNTYRVNKNGSDFKIRISAQTHLKDLELSAKPEFINTAAYTQLQNRYYPFALPFDLPWHTNNGYLSVLETNRYQLMETFRKGTNPADLEMAYEYIGMSKVTGDVITGITAGTKADFWGDTTDITKVNTFLTKTNLTYNQMIQLFECRFINPSGADMINIPVGESKCDASIQTITGLTDALLLKMHRFIRLWQIVGWQFWELDSVIMSGAIGAGSLNDDFIKKLQKVIWLQRSFQLPIESVVAMLDGFSTAAIPNSLVMNRLPLYHKLFLNKAMFQPLDEAFFPENIKQGTVGELPSITTMLADHADVIMGALKLSSAEFQMLEDATVNKKLTINNLDLIFRYALLARSLRLTIADLFTWIELHDPSVPPLAVNHVQNPFKNLDNLRSFSETVLKLQASSLKVNQYNYLFTHRNSATEAEAIDQKITKHIEGLRKAFISIDKELAVDGTDSAKEWVKLKLLTLVSFDEKTVDEFLTIVELNGVSALTNAQKTLITGWLDGVVPLTGATGLFAKLDEVTPADEETRLTAKYQFLKTNLTAYFKNNSYREQLVALTAASYKLSEQAAATLLQQLEVTAGQKLMQLFLTDVNIPTSMPVVAANFASLFKGGTLLDKAALMINTLSLNIQQVDFMLTHAAAAVLPAFNELPLTAASAFSSLPKLLNLVAFTQLSIKYPGSEELNLTTCFNEAFATTGTANNWYNLVASLTDWDAAELADTASYFAHAFPADYHSLTKFETLDRAMEQIMLLKSSATAIAELIKPQLTAEDALFAENVVKAQLDEATWFSKSAEVQAPIRLLKRNALTQYLINNPAPGEKWNNSNDLYSYYLIDTEMGAAEVTTRILQAGLSIQLFVQRCLMNLEAEVIADADTDLKWLQWKWMKNYRVWEANRKVFLYPENYLEPELRPDKSSFFKDLENDLMQNEINTENVETGYINYLEKLDNVARLNVCGTYYDEHTMIFHVFAHTYDEPRLYYYRKWVKDRYWTPWEKVTADIQSEQLIPVVRNSRLYIYWPEFNEVNEEPSSSDLTAPKGSSGSYSAAKSATKYTEIRLAVCEFKNKKWSAKKLSKTKIDTRNLPGGASAYSKEKFVFVPIIDSLQSVLDFLYMFIGNDPSTTEGVDDFLTLLGIENQNLLVCLYENGDNLPETRAEWNLNHVATFDLGSCHGTPEIADKFNSNVSSNPLLPYFDRTGYRDGEDREIYTSKDKKDELVFHQWGSNPFMNHKAIINKTPGNFRTQFSLQLSLADKFFYAFSTLIARFMWLASEKGRGEQTGIPYTTSTLLPFFYEDRSRTFMVQPELLITYPDPDDPSKVKADELFYSDVLHFINQFAANKKLPDELKKYREQGLKFEAKPALRFRNFYHPLACFFMKQLNTKGIDGLLNRDVQLVGDALLTDVALKAKVKAKYKDVKSLDFKKVYDPTAEVNPYKYPQEDVDFSADGSYAQYNWELFFHGPMYVAGKLSSNQKFEDAMKWYHYIFNPTDASSYSTPQKYWVTKPFFLRASTGLNDEYLKQRIDRILGMIHNNDLELLKQVEDWKDNPFQPHLIAQFRTVAYQKSVVMKYIDNLVAWGDSLFRQNTRESLGLATNLYILAAEILGPKPKIIPNRNSKTPKSYNQLKPGLDGFSNSVIQLENVIPSVPAVPEGTPAPPAPPLPAIETFYFCLPINEKLLGYWDTIGLRLFNLRNNLTIDGDPRFNALFDPPIDPALLVKAVASGVDLQDALSDMSAPLPYYRFNVILQKAKEFNNEVKALGGAIAAALEKKDGEAMALLRSTHEMKVLQAGIALKKYAILESKEGLAGLKQNKKNAELKIKYYGGQLYMNPLESAAFGISTASTVVHTIGSVADVLAGVLALIPQFNGGASGFGGSPHVTVSYGSEQIAKAAELGAKVMYQTSAIMDKVSGLVSTQAGYVRRKDEWDFQRKQAENDLGQINRQIAASEIKIAMGEKELLNHELQIDNSQQTDEFMRSKFTNIDLYDWMINQLSGVYFQSYKMALDMAKKAEKCFRYELAQENTGFIQAGYWDSLHKGLHAAEKLSFDLNRMDGSYLNQNKREHEMSKTISLSMLDPVALIELKETGKCELFIPESLFDMDCPGHYLRRIKTLSVSIPCIVGPYTSVNCKLTLMNSMVRKNTTGGNYLRDTVNEDARFVYNYNLVQSIVTSNAQGDSGMFETNLKDERYLPFEGQGVISRWKIELLDLEGPAGTRIRNFDFNTVSDVLLQMRYTARHGGDAFRKTVNNAITSTMNSIIEYATAAKNKFYRVIPVKHELATEWHRMFNPPLPTGDQELTLSLNHEWFPFFLKEKNLQIADVSIYVRYKKGVNAAPFKFAFDLASTANPPALGAGVDELKLKKYTKSGLNTPLSVNGSVDYKLIAWKQAGTVHSRFTANEIDDLVIVVHYETT